MYQRCVRKAREKKINSAFIQHAPMTIKLWGQSHLSAKYYELSYQVIFFLTHLICITETFSIILQKENCIFNDFKGK